MPVGHYGNGFKSGSMRLGKDALVLTKQEKSRSIGYLSQTYLDTIKAETVVVPIVTWDKMHNNILLHDSFVNLLKALGAGGRGGRGGGRLEGRFQRCGGCPEKN
jgi:hypothetical protein